MATLGIIVSSTRPNRIGGNVADWLTSHAQGWDVDLIDLRDEQLPHFDEAAPPKAGLDRVTDHARAWAERIGALDAAIILTPQYNGSYPGSLKNAIDYLYEEWSGLPTILVGYGWGDGAEVLELLSRLMSRFSTDVVAEIGLGLGADLSPEGELSIRPEKQQALLDALETLRAKSVERSAAPVA